MSQWGKTDANVSAPDFTTNATTGANGHTEYTAGTVLGISATEATVLKGAGSPGWVRVVEGTGGRAGRKSIETLVAMRNLTDV